MGEFICRACVIKIKSRKVKHFDNLWIKAETREAAKRKVEESLKNTEGTPLVFVKDIIEKV